MPDRDPAYQLAAGTAGPTLVAERPDSSLRPVRVTYDLGKCRPRRTARSGSANGIGWAG